MIDETLRHLRAAVSASKCHRCGCFRNAISVLATCDASAELTSLVANARAVLVDPEYDCIGCDPCWPADALNAAAPFVAVAPEEICATALVPTEGWPPLAGAYRVIRYAAPVAVCTLHSGELGQDLSKREPTGLSLVGSLETENLGIERLVINVSANPHIRLLLLCGADTDRQVGHFPGQSLVALVENGTDEHHRIIGARGRRPVLRNVNPSVVEHFRRQVEIVDRRGVKDAEVLAAVVTEAASRAPEPMVTVPDGCRVVESIAARAPTKLSLDPAGYVVIYVDRQRRQLVAEHYQNSGVLDLVITGAGGEDVMAELLGRSLVTRLDHSAYLGKELALAEEALRAGTGYRQDRAPEPPPRTAPPCGCSTPSRCKPDKT
jgi:tetrahydromethanopterin S-methyltransferase subunit A